MRKLLCVSLLASWISVPMIAADIDVAGSKITVHVEKSGLFSAFAHNHVISAPLASGHLNVEKRTVELKFRSQDLKVLDPGVSDSDRAEIQRTMQSDKVLDPARFPEISFVSTSVDVNGTQHYLVRGNLTLHGTTKPVELPVSFGGGHYTGKVSLKQTDYGITPVKIAGGAVKVKDIIEVVFEVVASK